MTSLRSKMSRKGASQGIASLSSIVFLASFLLFQVQPLISRYILPWFGGSSSVWSTALLFFQTVLLAGYAYAHFIATKSRQLIWLHLGLLVIATTILLLFASWWDSPLLPSSDWKLVDPQQPVLRILFVLLISVGLPYFLLASTSPLLQTWVEFIKPTQTPYYLYAISNLGSFLGLISYPLIFEPLLGLEAQSWIWSALYLVFSAVCCYLGIKVLLIRQKLNQQAQIYKKVQPQSGSEGAPQSLTTKLAWIALSACASILLLSVTNQLTQEIAVIPFLWVLPLSIYLFSFMLTFSGEKYYPRLPILALLAVATLSIGYRMNILTGTGVFTQVMIFSFFLLFATFACHGELYRLRPDASHLTTFYLFIAFGGVVGGLFVNLLAPVIFQGYWELHTGILLCWLLILVLQFIRRPSILDSQWVGEFIPMLLIILGLSGYLYTRQIQLSLTNVVEMRRNFYGVTRVQSIELGQPPTSGYKLKHGSTSHGFQFIPDDKRTIPTSYYSKQSGAGLALTHYKGSSDETVDTQPRKIGLIGLGIGTLASYGRVGETYRFYEINPDISTLALGNGNFFTYLADSPANIDIIPGDARLSLESELMKGELQYFDILLLDAFSSDAIPIHLLTVEAFDLYLKHMKPDGLLVLHISNRYLNLEPLVRGLADHFQLEHVLIHSNSDDQTGSSRATWMLLSKNHAFIEIPEIRQNSIQPPEGEDQFRVWTDDYSNLIPLIKLDIFENTQ